MHAGVWAEPEEYRWCLNENAGELDSREGGGDSREIQVPLFGALDLLRVYPAVHTGTDMFSGPAALLRVLAGGWARVPGWNQTLPLPLVLVSRP